MPIDLERAALVGQLLAVELAESQARAALHAEEQVTPADYPKRMDLRAEHNKTCAAHTKLKSKIAAHDEKLKARALLHSFIEPGTEEEEHEEQTGPVVIYEPAAPDPSTNF